MVHPNTTPENPKSKICRNSGFTLVELLVVVAIIVALAGVIIPNVSQFVGRGKAGAQVEEFDTIQSAMDSMMVDVGLITINPSPGVSKNTWKTFPNGSGVSPLDTYLRDSTTAYFYCWDSTGTITDQHNIADTCP